MAHKSVKILGVKVSVISRAQVLDFVRASLKSKQKFFITTPNPEIILQAQADRELKEAINTSDIALADGTGLIFAAKFLKLPKLQRITGREMFEILLGDADKNKLRVYLLGATPLVNTSALSKIKKNFPGINAKGSGDIEVDSKAYSDTEKDIKQHIDIINSIDSFRPHILFVALGAPKQEKWVMHNIENLNVGGAIVVGGALDYFVGKMNKPPEWMVGAGLEWLWRALQEPARFKRIFKAVVVFPVKIVESELFG